MRSLRAVEIAEDFFGRADGLLEDVVQVGEALDRFIEKEQRGEEADDSSGFRMPLRISLRPNQSRPTNVTRPSVR